MRIRFLDTVAPKPYSLAIAKEKGMGGSEATLIRVAEGLARNHDVVVEQDARESGDTTSPVRYLPMGACSPEWADITVVMRSLPSCRESKTQRTILWMHDLVAQPHATEENIALSGGAEIYCVSKWHAWDTKNFGFHNVRYVYNPIDTDALAPIRQSAQTDRWRLLFCSSPHKGLERTIQVFRELHKMEPRFHLFLASPGYWGALNIQTKKIHSLGVLPHAKVMAQLAKSFAMIQINDIAEETFGIVYAESAFMGVPVLTCDVGAAKEVLGSEEFVLPYGSTNKEYAERILSWVDNRPSIRFNPEFALENVLLRWEKILASPEAEETATKPLLEKNLNVYQDAHN